MRGGEGAGSAEKHQNRLSHWGATNADDKSPKHWPLKEREAEFHEFL